MRSKIIALGIVLVLLVSGIGTAMAFPDTKEEQSLVAYWAFDEGSGITVYDLSGNGNDGTIHGATWTTGISGDALSFGGIKDYVEVPDDSTLNFGTKDFTVGLWIKKGKSGKIEHPISKYIKGPGGTGWIICVGTDGRVRFSGRDGRIGDWWSSDWSDNVVDYNKWHYLVGRKCGTNIEIYIDGKLENSGEFGPGSVSNNEKMDIGRQTYEKSGYFNGIVDEVKIYNRALTEDEIKTEYEKYKTKNNGLVAYWSFDDIFENIAPDEAGNNDGTIYGAKIVDGVSGKALEFDGVDDYVKILHSQDFMFDSAFSVSFWVKPDYIDYTNNMPGIIVGKAMTRNEWTVNFYEGKIKSFFEYGSDSDEIISAYPPQNPIGKWSYVVVTYDSITNLHSIYWNSTLLTQHVSSSDPQITYTGPVGIGAEAESRIRFFNGTIDEVTVYNRALSTDEIKDHYEEYAIVPPPPPISQEHIKFIVTPLGDGKYNITYTEYAPFTVNVLRYSDGKGIAGVPLYQLEPKEIIEASKEYLQQNAPNIIGTQLTERAVTKILEEAGVYVFSGPFGIIIKVFSNLATAVDYLSYLTTPYIDLGAITDNEGKATLYLPNRAYTTTMDMSAFITQTQEPIDQTAPATQEQIAEQIASILLPTIQEELWPIAYNDITVAIPTKITIADEGVVTTETTEELKTYTKFRAINSKTVGNSRELIFWVEPKKIPPTTVGTGKEEEKAMKAHVLSPERHFFPHVVSLSHYFQNNGVNCNYIDLIGYLADISSWEALNSPLESRWPSSEDDFTVVIYSKEDKLNEYLTRKGMINHFPHETVLQGDGWAVTRYKQTTADISGEHERFIFSIVVTDDEKREEAIKAFIENAYQLVGLPTEEENGIPGFEAVFAVLGLLAVAYVLRRKK